MRKLDRYLIREMLGPFLFGMGAFAIVLLGVDLLYRALRMILEQNLPVGPVLLATLYRLPQTMVMTLPMAVIFAVLMAFGTLSSQGEITAMRAGGIGLYRMAGPALLLGLMISIVSFLLYGWLIPFCNNASDDVLAGLAKTAVSSGKALTLRIPSKGPLERLVQVEQFDAEAKRMRTVTIFEYRNDKLAAAYSADSAQWLGNTWLLTGVRHVAMTASGPLIQKVEDLRYNLGKSPFDVGTSKRELQDMSMRELRDLGRGVLTQDSQVVRNAREELALRLALPWAAVGLALVGLPLGIRPQRASTGVGLGISLAVILAYYIVISLMRILGQQGALHPALADWIPNLLLYTIGAGLLVNASK